MTILHGDDRFYNNIFLQKWPADDFVNPSDSEAGKSFVDNRKVGTAEFDEYPTYEEWISHFDMESDIPDMKKLEPYHWQHLPVWSEGNLYLNGAKAWKHEKNGLVVEDGGAYADVEEKDGRVYLKTNVYDFVKKAGFTDAIVDSDTLGKAFQAEERFESPDGSTIVFDRDYFGDHRGAAPVPGPFADGGDLKKPVW